MLDPLVASNVVNTAAGYSAVIADPAQRTGLAVQSVAQQLYLEASILAFNDTFRLLSILSLLTATGIGCLVVYRTLFLKHRKSE
jgi:hypothetical protein